MSYPTTLRVYSRIRTATLFTRWFWINPKSLQNKLPDERIVIKAPRRDVSAEFQPVVIAIGSSTDSEVKKLQAEIEEEGADDPSFYSRGYLLETLYKAPESHDHASQQSGRFWKTVRRHIRKFRGITTAKLPEYLGEFAFRENHARHDMFKTLLDTLLNIPPSHVAKPARAKDGLRNRNSTNPVSRK